MWRPAGITWRLPSARHPTFPPPRLSRINHDGAGHLFASQVRLPCGRAPRPLRLVTAAGAASPASPPATDATSRSHRPEVPHHGARHRVCSRTHGTPCLCAPRMPPALGSARSGTLIQQAASMPRAFRLQAWGSRAHCVLLIAIATPARASRLRMRPPPSFRDGLKAALRTEDSGVSPSPECTQFYCPPVVHSPLRMRARCPRSLNAGHCGGTPQPLWASALISLRSPFSPFPPVHPPNPSPSCSPRANLR